MSSLYLEVSNVLLKVFSIYLKVATRFPSLDGPLGRGDNLVFSTCVAAHWGGEEKYFVYVRDGPSKSGPSKIFLVGDIFN